MAHVDQLLQIDLKQLPLWLCRLALGSHRFSPVFRPFANHYREILDQQSSQIIGFYHGFSGFSATTKEQHNPLWFSSCFRSMQQPRCGIEETYGGAMEPGRRKTVALLRVGGRAR
jgi:hypothetical protein